VANPDCADGVGNIGEMALLAGKPDLRRRKSAARPLWSGARAYIISTLSRQFQNVEIRPVSSICYLPWRPTCGGHLAPA
jgi:hypothetical protein